MDWSRRGLGGPDERKDASRLLGEEGAEVGSERLSVGVDIEQLIAEVHSVSFIKRDQFDLLVQGVEQGTEDVKAGFAEAAQDGRAGIEGELPGPGRGTTTAGSVGLLCDQDFEAASGQHRRGGKPSYPGSDYDDFVTVF